MLTIFSITTFNPIWNVQNTMHRHAGLNAGWFLLLFIRTLVTAALSVKHRGSLCRGTTLICKNSGSDEELHPLSKQFDGFSNTGALLLALTTRRSSLHAENNRPSKPRVTTVLVGRVRTEEQRPKLFFGMLRRDIFIGKMLQSSFRRGSFLWMPTKQTDCKDRHPQSDL